MIHRWFGIVAEIAAERALAVGVKLHVGLFYTDGGEPEPYIRVRFSDSDKFGDFHVGSAPLAEVDVPAAREMAAREIDAMRATP